MRMRRRCSLLVVAFLLMGCAGRSACPAFATLERITLEGSVGAEPTVEVKREGKLLRSSELMPLERGDLVSTGPHATAVLRFAGARAVLKPNTKVELGSLLAWFGEFFVSGWLNTHTKYAAASVEGTKYHVKVDAKTNQATFTVLEGRVKVTPRQAHWETITLKAGQRTAVGEQDREAPQTTTIPQEELEVLTEEAYAMGHPQRPVLPSVQGLALAAAQQRLAALGLAPRIEEVPILETAEGSAALIGHVIAQDPPPGTRADHITLTVGWRGAEVPKLLGVKRTEAERQLAGVGLTLGTVEVQGAETGRPLQGAGSALGKADTKGGVVEAPAAFVVMQDPSPGLRVIVGTPINVTLGDRPPAAQDGPKSAADEVAVPDVTGAPLERALASLADAGLGAHVQGAPQIELHAPRVVTSNPLPQHKLQRGAQVELVVAFPGVRVPNVHGLSSEAATQALHQAGLGTKIIATGGATEPGASVATQQPEAGVTALLGAEVVITLSMAAAEHK